MSLETLIGYVSTAVFAISTIISIIVGAVRGENGSKVKVARILQKLPGYIATAESLFPSSESNTYGTAKLEYVLNKVNLDCIQSSVKYNADEWTVEIENILSTPSKKSVV